MVAFAKHANLGQLTHPASIGRVASWLPPRPGGYRMFFRTGEAERIPVSLLRDSRNELRLEVAHPVKMCIAQPIVFVCGRRRIMGTVRRTTPAGEGGCCVEVALNASSMATRHEPLTEEDEVLLCC
jgi:hypothetical protein